MKKFIWILLIWPFLSGCGISFYYNKLDWFAKWYLDDFVELNSVQSDIFDAHFERWHQWHRQNQLPLYREQLVRLKQDLKQGITSEQVIVHTQHARDHWLNLLKHLAPDIAHQLLTLNQNQKRELIENLHQKIEERAESWNEKTQKERYQDAKERHIEDFENWFGRLSEQQEKAVIQQLVAYQPNRELWLTYRKAYLQQFESVLFAQQDPAQSAKLSNLLANPESMRSAQLKQSIRINRTLYAEFIVSFINQASAKQKQHLINELDEYLSELNALID